MVVKDFRPSIAEVAPIIQDVVNSGKRVRLTVTGCSMYPLFVSDSDTVTLEKAESINKYDVVLFKRKTGKYVLHRVIKVENGVFTIAGDNETKKEYPVYRDEVIAKMHSYERRGISHCVDDKWFKVYSRFWLWIFPFRRIITRGIFKCPVADEE